MFLFFENCYYINERYQGDCCLEEEEPMIARMICNFAAQDGHQHAAEVGDDGLDREIRPFASGAYAIHRGGIDHDRRHPVTAPEEEDPAVEQRSCRMDIREGEEIERCHQHEYGKEDARPVTSDPANDHPSGKGGEEADERTSHAAHHPDLFHVVAQVDEPGFQHGERPDQPGIVEEEETDLLPDVSLREEVDDVCLFCPLMRFLRLDADAFVEKERQEGDDDKQREAGQQAVPPDLFEEQEQDAAPDHRAAETAHRLHAVGKALILAAEGEHGQRVGRDVLRGGGDKGDDDQCHDRVEIRVEVEKGDREDQRGIDQFGGEDPPFVVAGSHGMAVYHRRPEKFQYPRQLDQLKQPDGRQRKVLLPHHHRDDGRKEAHRDRLRNV